MTVFGVVTAVLSWQKLKQKGMLTAKPYRQYGDIDDIEMIIIVNVSTRS